MPQQVQRLRAELARLREENAELQHMRERAAEMLGRAISERIHNFNRGIGRTSEAENTVLLCISVCEILVPGLEARLREEYREEHGHYPEEAESEAETEPEPGAEPDIGDDF